MKKGFTLIELVIVIGILAILATVVVLVLNPAQMLAQARDSQRMSDLGSIKSAIALYLATATSTTLTAGPNSTFAVGCWFGVAPTCTATCTLNASTTVNGTGWVAVNLTGTTGGSPLSALPLDPSQTADYQYAYIGNDTYKTFELNANLESTKYSGLEATDGGNCVGIYEVGTDPGLDLP
jgi:prepilin-type N-terminal cleavage/methylation domain-containing protein